MAAFTDLCLLAIVFLLCGITYIVWQGLQITRVQHITAMAALASLGDTHKFGLETLMSTMQKLDQRLTIIETRLGLNGRTP